MTQRIVVVILVVVVVIINIAIAIIIIINSSEPCWCRRTTDNKQTIKTVKKSQQVKSFTTLLNEKIKKNRIKNELCFIASKIAQQQSTPTNRKTEMKGINNERAN